MAQDPLDDTHRHLRAALAAAEDNETAFHVRQALQLLVAVEHPTAITQPADPDTAAACND